MKGCRSLTDQEVEQVLQVLTCKRDKLLFLLGVKSGLRISELLSLRIRDVMEHGRVGTYLSVAKANTKGKIESRTLPITDSAKSAIQTYLDELKVFDPNQPLFVSSQSVKAITRIRAHKILGAAFAALQLTGKLSSHAMRKTYANRIHKALGEKIEKTQQAMGHKSLSSTVSYLAVDQDEVNAAIMKQG